MYLLFLYYSFRVITSPPTLFRALRLTWTETYGPVLQARRDRATRTWVGKSAKPTSTQSLKKTLSVALIRPFRMFSEPIVLATSLFMAMVYAIFYLFFEAYPIIFGGKKPHLPASSTSYIHCLGLQWLTPDQAYTK